CAAKLLLHPRGLALPHYADSSKIGYVVQGSCTVGLIPPNSSEETIVVIKKGDVIPMSMGVMSWWFNASNTDVVIIFLGETSKALEPGQFTYFFMAGALGILAGFQSDFVARIFSLDRKEAKTLVSNQHETLITVLEEGIKIPEPSKHILDTIHATIVTPSADVVVKEAGMVNSVTEEKIPTLGGIGLSARFVKLEGNAMLAPTYTADGSVVLSYVTKGSGKIRVVGSTGKTDLDTKVEEGDLIIVPPFFAAAEIADVCGMEIFSVITSSMPVTGKLAGNLSFWNASSPLVLQSALNINPELTARCKPGQQITAIKKSILQHGADEWDNQGSSKDLRKQLLPPPPQYDS
ncbi:putative 11-S seed storage protein, plant, partial [Tanacetum coccineum]